MIRIRHGSHGHRGHGHGHGHGHKKQHSHPHGQPHTTQHNPPDKTAGYGVNKVGAEQAKAFNTDLIYCQGFRQQVAAGQTVPITISLNSPGKWLHGISIIPTAASDITDTQLNFVVNNNNVLVKAAAQNYNPGFVHGQTFIPTPQPLFGTDTITLNVTNNGLATITITANMFYVPRV